jgi:type I restriction-modification system DNA methylase subunit
LSREAPFQDRLRDAIQGVISKFKFDGLTFSKVERGFSIDGREPDLTIFDEVGMPFLIIETKRKIEHPHRRVRDLFQPLGKVAIGQAISYAVLWENSGRGRIPFFATATPLEIAVFRTPDNLLEYVDMNSVLSRDYEDVVKPGMFTKLLKHLVFQGRLELTEEFIGKLLDIIAKDYLKTKVSRISPGWALIGLLRNFVDIMSEKCEPMVKLKSERDEEFKKMLEEMEAKLGYEPDVKSLARMMVYVLMNKLIFYKVLEQRYRGLPRLINLPISSKTEFINALNNYFERAMSETKDFEPIFKTGIYDMIDFPDEPDTLEFINEFIATIEGMRVEEIGDYASYIYEELIPPSERHQLGQFYTPPAICELIAKWAIRNPDDIILDPGCGSGGFLSAAYRFLVKLKTGRDMIPPPRGVHEKIVSQLYGVDINAFPAHLSAVNLAMKDIRAPSTGLNIIEEDFFTIEPNTVRQTPYTIRTAAGEFKREIKIPTFDVVIGNPPYTRWVEIPKSTQKVIKKKLEELIREYGLTPQLARGVEPGIYTYWIMHATKFLKSGGRLGMIISNLWMQTDYGVGFGQFLLDNYKIKAIVDFTLRLFTALISTCIILAEREEDASKRAENEIVFIHIPGTIESIDVDDILKVVKERKSEKLYVKVVKQKDIPRNEKWIKTFFFEVKEVEEIFKNPLMVKLSDLFEPSRGNTHWSIWALQHGRRPDPGASDFVYLSSSKAKQFNLEKFSYPNVPIDQAMVYPAIISARDAVYFTFTEDDWRKLYDSNKECFMLICHKPRNKLPKEILEYVKWGESSCPECGDKLKIIENMLVCPRDHRFPLEAKCITKIRGTRGGGRFANETESAKVRDKTRKEFYGWYDLGGMVKVPIFAIYHARYKTRFVYCKFPIATSHQFITLIPKGSVHLNEVQLKALLAYLNSSLTQYYIEARGTPAAKGPIGLEVSIARDMPILDVRRLSGEHIAEFASLFDRLEAEARRIGGASEKEQLEKLKNVIYDIDRALAKLFNMPEDIVRILEDRVNMLIERRVAGSKEERRESVKGEIEIKLKPPRKSRRKVENDKSLTLDRFIT